MSTTKNTSKKEVVLPTLGEDQVFIHNSSKGTFHVALVKKHPSAEEDPIVFELNEVRRMDKAHLKEQRFADAMDKGFLEVFTPQQYADFQKAEKFKKTEATRKEVKGNYKSGLPNSQSMALKQIGLMDDVDELAAILEEENRPAIMIALEERIEEIQNSTFAD